MARRKKFMFCAAGIIFVVSVLMSMAIHRIGTFDGIAGIEPPSFSMAVFSVIVVIAMFAGMTGIAFLIYRIATRPQKPWGRKMNFYCIGGRHDRKVYIHP
ncbi:MAG: hypothetical protein D4Q79_02070 [Spirochaetia bacterium]|nr:MAG: hypothetical protein D4Q79_02070 [Spirochaetia bacterium]